MYRDGIACAYATEVQRQYLAGAEQRRLLAAARKVRRARERRARVSGAARIAYVFGLRPKGDTAQQPAS
jgi:hypothetical protein